MISVFQLFKIIFGIVFSVFVLVIILRFSYSYTDIGSSSQQAAVLVGMRKVVNDVYTTGIPADYSIPNSDDVIIRYRPPDIISAITSLTLDPITVLLMKGDNVGIYRNEIDLGWHTFYYVEVFPGMNVLISPVNASGAVWDTARDIVDAFPSTENIETEVVFGFGCRDGQPFVDRTWEVDKVSERIIPAFSSGGYDNLTACGEMRNFDGRITIADHFFVTDGLLVVPRDGSSGYIYSDTSDDTKRYFYDHPLDVVSFFFGGEESYNYTNEKFLSELEFAAGLKIDEMSILREHMGTYCAGEYDGFSAALETVETLASKDYRSEGSMDLLGQALADASEEYADVRREGCD